MKLLGSQVLNREVLIEEQKEIRKKLIKKFEREQDPEYAEYLRLHKKFGS